MLRTKTLNALPDVLTVADVCFILSASKPTVLKLAKEEGSPFFKVGQSWRVLKSELLDYLKGK